MSDNPAVKAADGATENRRVALLIAALALALALTEVAGDGAKMEVQMRNVESANLWAFFQARTIRQTILGALVGAWATGEETVRRVWSATTAPC